MKTTVVIPNYNGIEYLKNCINSLMESRACYEKSHNGEGFAIVVVDNGSTDGSPDWIKSMGSDILLLEMGENTGFAPAVNRGIGVADTPYVLLLNNDTIVAPDMVSRLEEAIESDDKVFSVNTRMVTMQDNHIIDGCGDYYTALGWAFAGGKGKSADKCCMNRKRIFSACGGASLYRKDVLDKLGGFDDLHFAYLEDVDIGYHARIEGYKNIYEPNAVCIHAGSASSGSRYNEFKVNLSSRNSVYLPWKNMPLLQYIINLPLLLVGYIVKALFFALKGYGFIYIRGLGRGIALCFSRGGRARKVRYRLNNTGNYVIIQLELWINVLRRLYFF